MSKRWMGVAASVVLALVGAFLLVRYVQGADERALEGEETVEVLVVTAAVDRGTRFVPGVSPGEELKPRRGRLYLSRLTSTVGGHGRWHAREGGRVWQETTNR